MRRRLSRRGLAVGVALLAVAGVTGVVLAPDLGGSGSERGAPPAALNRIAQKNDRAATEAAERLRARSEASAKAADSMRAASERGRAEAEETLARFENSEANRTDRIDN